MSLNGSYAKAALELIVSGLTNESSDTWMMPVLTLLEKISNNNEIKAIYDKVLEGKKSGEPADDWMTPIIEKLHNFINNEAS